MVANNTKYFYLHLQQSRDRLVFFTFADKKYFYQQKSMRQNYFLQATIIIHIFNPIPHRILNCNNLMNYRKIILKPNMYMFIH